MVDQGSLTPGLGATSGLQVAFLWSSTEPFVYCKSQWRLLRGRQLIIMAGMERMEWHQTQERHVFYVFDNIPPIPLLPLPQALPLQLKVPPTSCDIFFAMFISNRLCVFILSEQQLL